MIEEGVKGRRDQGAYKSVIIIAVSSLKGNAVSKEQGSTKVERYTPLKRDLTISWIPAEALYFVQATVSVR